LQKATSNVKDSKLPLASGGRELCVPRPLSIPYSVLKLSILYLVLKVPTVKTFWSARFWHKQARILLNYTVVLIAKCFALVDLLLWFYFTAQQF